MNEIAFKQVTIDDKEAIEFYLNKDSSICLCAFTFCSLVSWEKLYHYQWAVVDNTLLFKFTTVEDGQEHLLKPFGEFPFSLQENIIRYAQSLDYKLTIFGASDEFMEHHATFAAHFDLVKIREFDNYLYLAENLALLKGRDYQSKRNLINQFETNNPWTSEPISADNIAYCHQLLNTIYSSDDLNTDFYLGYEVKALDFVLAHFALLGEEGLLIRADGRPVAFSIYERLNASTYVVHFEKALKEYKGLYQLVNRETAKHIVSKGIRYINREEDLGIEGLRKSKLSYHPVELSPSHALVFNK
ncbi:MAG: phosphatidylglycerol lysyltransferase domain-containing protein [Bacteroidota bacterium]